MQPHVVDVKTVDVRTWRELNTQARHFTPASKQLPQSGCLKVLLPPQRQWTGYRASSLSRIHFACWPTRQLERVQRNNSSSVEQSGWDSSKAVGTCHIPGLQRPHGSRATFAEKSDLLAVRARRVDALRHALTAVGEHFEDRTVQENTQF